MRLVETWVKAPFLKEASLLLISECAQDVFPDVYDEFAKGRVVLTSCPEVENAGTIMSKLASMLTCSNPSDVTVLTMEGSPHCLTLHFAANAAVFTTKSNVPISHFVVLERKAMKVSPESVRVARYLHLVEKCIQRCPEVLEDLSRHSLEHSCG